MAAECARHLRGVAAECEEQEPEPDKLGLDDDDIMSNDDLGEESAARARDAARNMDEAAAPGRLATWRVLAGEDQDEDTRPRAKTQRWQCE